MRYLAIAVAIVGCGEPHDPQIVIPEADARCPVFHTSTCNPLTQNGCNAGESCTWFIDSEEPPIGHVGCAPRGDVPIGGSCTRTPLLPDPCRLGYGSYDDCAPGAACHEGVCKQICDLNGDLPRCDADLACLRHANIFEVGGDAVAGLCEPGCDPLTQERRLVADVTACGSPTPTAPTMGCYGFDDFSCASIEPDVLARMDRDPPRLNPTGHPYLNGCAPGFIPFFQETTGSTTILCSGFCAALEIDNTQPGNNQGDPTALAKMPSDPAPAVGHGVCSAQYKGSSETSSCRFIYPYLADDSTGELPMAFEQSAYLDTLGVCLEYMQFTYDDDMNAATPNVPYPSCTDLPPRSNATPGTYDDAADWGCQKRAMPSNSALRQLRVPKHAPLELVRHTFAD